MPEAMSVEEAFATYVADWRLVVDGAPIETPTSTVLPVMRDGAALMLKRLKPGSDEAPGILALAWFGGEGAVAVLERSDDAVLMERAAGTRSLTAMALAGDDDGALRILLDAAAGLQAPRAAPPPALPSLERRFPALFAAGSVHPVLPRAATMARHLIATEQLRTVLHGDLHHENVLDAPRGWLAIDPKGVHGDPAYDVANLFLNPAGVERLVLDPARASRLAGMAADRLTLDPARILGFAFAHAGLSAAWCIEDGIDPRIAIEAALMLETVIAGSG